jgi:hypothetical protein
MGLLYEVRFLSLISQHCITVLMKNLFSRHKVSPMKMDLERIGSRHRGNSHQFSAESEELDQIAKEVRGILTAPIVTLD